MRAPLSIIIPTLNAEDVLPATLGALYEGVQAGLVRELIVVDGGSGDGTCEMASQAGAHVLSTSPSRGGQLRAGGQIAQGDWLLFLHADSVPDAGWPDAVAAHLTEQKAGWFRLRFDAEGFAPRWVAGWANLRSRLFGLPYGDQGLLVPRRLYEQVGGYAVVPLMEDVRMARALRGNLKPLNCVVTTGAERYQREGWLRRGTRNFRTMLRYGLGVSPQDLSRDYARRD